MSKLALFLLGSFQATLDGRPITGFESNKVRALLAYLAVEADRPHSRDELIGLLWPDQPDSTARANLRQALANLRLALGDRDTTTTFISNTSDGIQFQRSSEHAIDVTKFSDLLAECRAHAHRRIETCRSCVQCLQQAVELYRGDFLAHFLQSGSAAFEEWALVRREHWHRAALEALYSLAEYSDRRGDYDRVQHDAARQLELDPWREEAHRQMMRALALSGQRSAALAQYEICRCILADELGAEPSEDTLALLAKIKADTLRSKPSVSNLPIPTTRLIGRERELQQIAALLENPECRLLTLTGPGGIGKTRLALQTATDQRWAFADGVQLVEFAALRNPALVPQTVAAALDVHEQLTKPLLQTLIDFLQSREVLLVLDNCEHLVEACARFAEAVLQGCARLCILATSSEMLDIDGEQVLLVPPLATPDPYHLPPLPILSQYAAVRLFADRAAWTRAHFTLTGDNAFAIAQICHRLDGIPLAIELVSRVKDMTAEQIAEHLDQRFQLLTSGSRTAWPQHKTLRAMMDWSHSLLSEPERILFRRLSVFVGGWTFSAAEAVCAGDLIAAAQVRDLLTQLVNKSLVAINESGRYRLLETIREYAREKLSDQGELEHLQSRQASFFLEMAQAGQSRLRGPEQLVWLKQIVTELDNLRIAFHWARERGDAEMCASFAASLTWFWEWCGYLREGRQWLEIALSATASRPVSSQLQARALYGLGVVALRQADFALAAQSLEQSMALWRTMGDPSSIAEVVVYLGNIALTTGDFGQAAGHYQESLALFRELGNQWGEALSLGNLGLAALFQRDLVQASLLMDEALALLQTIGDRFFSGSILLGKAYVHFLLGEHERAEVIGHDGLQMVSEAGDKLFLNYGVVLMASVAAARRQSNRAARLLGVSAMLSDVFGVPLPPVVQIMAEQVVAAARLQLDVAFFESAWAEGRAMTLEQAIEYALGSEDEAS